MSIRPDMNWAQWPRDGAEPAIPEETVKTAASYPESPEPSLSELVSSISAVLPVWVAELPQGIEKVAAKREGVGDELPVVTAKNIWRHPKAHPLILTLLLLDRYTPEYMIWAPETLRLTLKRDGILVSNSVWTKILAARVLFNSPSPWRRWEVFHWISIGLSGRPPNFSFMEEPELAYLAAAADIMRIVDPPRDFDEEVEKYVATAAHTEGVACLPPPLEFAQRELDDPHIRCKRCGTKDRDDNDVKCVACGSTQLEKIPHPYASVCEEVLSLLRTRMRLPLEQAVKGLLDTTAGNMAKHILIHWDHRNQTRANLITQFRALKNAP
jgi:ribosomal protein L37E